MCPPAELPPPAEIGIYWSDEQIISLLNNLNEYIPGISRLPNNVLADSSPYQYPPSNLPEGIWYLVHSNEKKEYVHGFWRAKGDSCNVYSNSMFTGWRTTLEYFAGKAPNEQRTDWVMQEYRVAQKKLRDKDIIKESRLLCRVFLCCGPENAMHSQNCKTVLESKKIESIESNTNIISCKDSKSESKAKKESEVGALSSPQVLSEVLECFSRGDYLELNDLEDPESHSSSSQNSSCPSKLSDEYFDSSAFLRDLEEEENNYIQGQQSSSRYNFASSIVPNDVVLQPPSSCSILSGAVTSGEVEGSAAKRHNSESTSEGSTSSSHSDGSQKNAGTSREKKLVKKLKTYFCFASF